MFNQVWPKFKDVINNLAHPLFNQKEVIWMRLIENVDYHGEGVSRKYNPIQLKVLIGFNDFRVWPMDKNTETGAVDVQNMYLLINKAYLEGLGYINENGYFAFNTQNDYFIVDGIEYTDSGDTDVSQAGVEAVLFYMILQRRSYVTGKTVHGRP